MLTIFSTTLSAMEEELQEEKHSQQLIKTQNIQYHSSSNDKQSNNFYLILSVRSPLKASLHEMLSGLNPQEILLIAGSQFFTEDDRLSLTPFYNTIIRIEDYRLSGNLELEAYKLHKDKPFHKVIAYHEYDLLRAARLREFFNIEGQSYQSAIAYRDKILMKQFLQEAGVKVPPFSRVNSPLDIIEFARKNDFPIVVKPILGTGSDRAIVLRNSHEINNYVRKEKVFNDYYQTDLEVESYINGTTYHIEGFIYKGEVIASWPSICINHSIDLNKGKYIGHHHLSYPNDLIDQLNNYAKKVIAALPNPGNSAFLLEVFKEEKTNELIFCEIASRVGGGVKEMWMEDFEIDVEAEFIRVQAGLEVNEKLINFFQRFNLQQQPDSVSGWIIFPKLVGNLLKIPESTPFPWVKRYYMKVQPGTTTSCTVNVSDTLASAFLTSSNEKEFNEHVNLLINWFSQNTDWEILESPHNNLLNLETRCSICKSCEACQECEEIDFECYKECCKGCGCVH